MDTPLFAHVYFRAPFLTPYTQGRSPFNVCPPVCLVFGFFFFSTSSLFIGLSSGAGPLRLSVGSSFYVYLSGPMFPSHFSFPAPGPSALPICMSPAIFYFRLYLLGFFFFSWPRLPSACLFFFFFPFLMDALQRAGPFGRSFFSSSCPTVISSPTFFFTSFPRGALCFFYERIRLRLPRSSRFLVLCSEAIQAPTGLRIFLTTPHFIFIASVPAFFSFLTLFLTLGTSSLVP